MHDYSSIITITAFHIKEWSSAWTSCHYVNSKAVSTFACYRALLQWLAPAVGH